MVAGYALLRDWRLLSALWYPIRNWRRLMRKRMLIQAKRRVSDRELARWFANFAVSEPLGIPERTSSPHAAVKRA